MVFKHGVVDGYMYVNNVKVEKYTLVELDGDLYFVSDYRKVAKNQTIYLSETFTKGFTYANGEALKPGYYTFDAEGKMVVRHGVVNGFLYVNNEKVERYALVELDGDFYFVSDYHKVAKNQTIYLSETFTKGFTYANGEALKPGYYTFDAEGKMVYKHGVVDGYMYINNVKVERYTLVEIDGELYFVSDYHKVAKNQTIYLKESFVSSFINADGTPLKPGYYTFDAEGKMVR